VTVSDKRLCYKIIQHINIFYTEELIMIEIFVGLITLLLLSDGKKEQTDPEEYYPFMYDHFTHADGDSYCEGED